MLIIYVANIGILMLSAKKKEEKQYFFINNLPKMQFHT